MRRNLQIFLVLFLLGFLAYANGLNNKFLWDDAFILNEPDMSQMKFILSQWDPNHIRYFAGYYRPLAHMVYGFCYSTFKNNFWQYHLFNLFLFVLICFLVYVLIVKLTRNIPLALLSAILFLLHPINGIMVNNIVTSALSLLMLFALGAILLLWEALERNSHRVLYLLSVVISFLSVFLYDMGIMVPAYLAVVMLFFRKEKLVQKALYLFPYFFINISYLVFRHFYLNGSPLSVDLKSFHMTLLQWFATITTLVFWYISKLFVLQGIVMQWATPIIHKGALAVCLQGIVLLVLLSFIFIKFWKERIIPLAITWMLIGFSPIAVTAFMNPDAGAFLEPHWFVFSALGIFILAAYVFVQFFNRFQKTGAVLLLVIFFAFAVSCRAYNGLWGDQKEYALYWAKQAPSIRVVYSILAEVYNEEGNLKEANRYYRLTNHGSYITATASNNIGVIELKKGHLEAAERDFKLVLLIDPRFASAYYELGVINYSRGNKQLAKSYMKEALSIDPYLIAPRNFLAGMAMSDNNYQEAIALYLKNLDINKEDFPTISLLIAAYFKQGDLDALGKFVRRTVEEENDPKLLTSLAAIMFVNHFNDLAQACYDKVLKVSPRYQAALLDEGTLFESQGQFQKAYEVWQQGLKYYPSEQRFTTNLERIRARMK